jgi:hypothetical protein
MALDKNDDMIQSLAGDRLAPHGICRQRARFAASSYGVIPALRNAERKSGYTPWSKRSCRTGVGAQRGLRMAVKRWVH